ncbi:hypothetical protein ABPG73_021019 [Tetrahymena malaccensis]
MEIMIRQLISKIKTKRTDQKVHKGKFQMLQLQYKVNVYSMIDSNKEDLNKRNLNQDEQDQKPKYIKIKEKNQLYQEQAINAEKSQKNKDSKKKNDLIKYDVLPSQKSEDSSQSEEEIQEEQNEIEKEQEKFETCYKKPLQDYASQIKRNILIKKEQQSTTTIKNKLSRVTYGSKEDLYNQDVNSDQEDQEQLSEDPEVEEQKEQYLEQISYDENRQQNKEGSERYDLIYQQFKSSRKFGKIINLKQQNKFNIQSLLSKSQEDLNKQDVNSGFLDQRQFPEDPEIEEQNEQYLEEANNQENRQYNKECLERYDQLFQQFISPQKCDQYSMEQPYELMIMLQDFTKKLENSYTKNLKEQKLEKLNNQKLKLEVLEQMYFSEVPQIKEQNQQYLKQARIQENRQRIKDAQQEYETIQEMIPSQKIESIYKNTLKPIQFKLSEKEIKIILKNQNQLVIGRSGTGKTTTAAVKLSSMQMGYDMAQKDKFLTESSEKLRICFTTISNYLTLDVENFFNRIMGKQQLRALIKPSTLSQIQRWPHFTNIKELILQIDGNLAVPFIQRDMEGKIIQVQNMEINLENRLIVKLKDEIEGDNQYSEIGIRQFVEEFWLSNKTRFDKLKVDPYVVYSQINSYITALFSEKNRGIDTQINKTLSSELNETQLTQNFRSHGQIIELNNFIVKLLEIFFPTSLDHLIPEISLNKGPKPILINKREHLYKFLSQDQQVNDNVDYFGRLQVYIVKNLDEKNILKQILQQEEEFEGSTFSRKKGSDYVKIKSISKKHDADAQIKKEYSQDFNKLINELKNIYVAFSRARSRIFIYEEEIFVGKQIKNPFIKLVEDLNIIEQQELNKESIQIIMKEHLDYIKKHEPIKNNKQQFISMAEMLIEREQFLDAANYYEIIGDELKKRVCIGKDLINQNQKKIKEKKEQFEKEKKQMLLEQVDTKQLVFYQSIKKELLEAIQNLEGSQEFELIAKIYFTLGMYDEAIKSYKYFKDFLQSSANFNQDQSKIKEIDSNIKQIYFTKADYLESNKKFQNALEQNYIKLERYIKEAGIQDTKVQLFISFRLKNYVKLFDDLIKFKQDNLIEIQDLIRILHYYYPKILEQKLEQIMHINTNENEALECVLNKIKQQEQKDNQNEVEQKFENLKKKFEDLKAKYIKQYDQSYSISQDQNQNPKNKEEENKFSQNQEKDFVEPVNQLQSQKSTEQSELQEEEEKEGDKEEVSIQNEGENIFQSCDDILYAFTILNMCNQKSISILKIGLAEIYLLLQEIQSTDKIIKVCIPSGFENYLSFDQNVEIIKVKTYSTDVNYRLIYLYINQALDLIGTVQLTRDYLVPIFNMVLQILILFLKKQTQIVYQKDFENKIQPFKSVEEYSDLSKQAQNDNSGQKQQLYENFSAKFHKTFLHLIEKAVNSKNKYQKNQTIKYDFIQFIEQISHSEIQNILINDFNTQNIYCELQIIKLENKFQQKDTKVIEECNKLKPEINIIKQSINQSIANKVLDEQEYINIFYKQDFIWFMSYVVYYKQPSPCISDDQIQLQLQKFEENFLKINIQIQKVRKIFLQELNQNKLSSSEKYIYIIQKLNSIAKDEKEFYTKMIQIQQLIIDNNQEQFQQQLEQYSIEYMNKMEKVYLDYLNYITEPFEKIEKESLSIKNFIKEQIKSKY